MSVNDSPDRRLERPDGGEGTLAPASGQIHTRPFKRLPRFSSSEHSFMSKAEVIVFTAQRRLRVVALQGDTRP
jgi:hypothetical protein